MPWVSSLGNRPLSAKRLRERVARARLSNVLEARNGALAALAMQLLPALLVDHTGLSLSAASKWSKATGASRATCAGLRTR
jgi:hypothetical protein